MTLCPTYGAQFNNGGNHERGCTNRHFRAPTLKSLRYKASYNQLNVTLKESTMDMSYDGNPIEYKTISSPNPLGIYRRYKDIEYTVSITPKFGYLQGSDKSLLYESITNTTGNWLENLFSSFEISAVRWQEGKVTNTGSFFRPKYELTYPDEWKTLDQISITERANWEAAKISVIKNALQADLENKNIVYVNSELVSINTSVVIRYVV